MISSELTPEELEVQLEQLHENSFGWALSCCGWDEADAEDVPQTTYLTVRLPLAAACAYRHALGC